MKKLIYVPVILSMVACTLLKNTRKSTDDHRESSSLESSQKASTEIQAGLSSQQLIYKKDDVNTDYTVSFWPKGQLNFLPDGGFTGEFDSVQMKGSHHKISKSAERLKTENKLKEKNQSERNAEAKNSSRKKSLSESSSPNLKAVVALLFVLACVFCVVLFAKKRT